MKLEIVTNYMLRTMFREPFCDGNSLFVSSFLTWGFRRQLLDELWPMLKDAVEHELLEELNK